MLQSAVNIAEVRVNLSQVQQILYMLDLSAKQSSDRLPARSVRALHLVVAVAKKRNSIHSGPYIA